MTLIKRIIGNLVHGPHVPPVDAARIRALGRDLHALALAHMQFVDRLGPIHEQLGEQLQRCKPHSDEDRELLAAYLGFNDCFCRLSCCGSMSIAAERLQSFGLERELAAANAAAPSAASGPIGSAMVAIPPA